MGNTTSSSVATARGLVKEAPAAGRGGGVMKPRLVWTEVGTDDVVWLSNGGYAIVRGVTRQAAGYEVPTFYVFLMDGKTWRSIGQNYAIDGAKKRASKAFHNSCPVYVCTKNGHARVELGRAQLELVGVAGEKGTE